MYLKQAWKRKYLFCRTNTTYTIKLLQHNVVNEHTFFRIFRHPRRTTQAFNGVHVRDPSVKCDTRVTIARNPSKCGCDTECAIGVRSECTLRECNVTATVMRNPSVGAILSVRSKCGCAQDCGQVTGDERREAPHMRWETGAWRQAVGGCGRIQGAGISAYSALNVRLACFAGHFSLISLIMSAAVRLDCLRIVYGTKKCLCKHTCK